MEPQHKPELLAPAGDWEAMRAAVANGADAVYFGLSQFNARARATNFNTDELPAVIDYLHRHNVRGFVTLNTLIFPDELPAVAEFIHEVARAGADAVIVQDLGLVRLIRALAPTLPVHASTQMTLTEPRGIELIRQLGVRRVVLARELSLADIRRVTENTDTPVEAFIHGALCVAYSGQCLTSEALGGRSANRGQCAQACRLPYELVVDGDKRELGDKAYLLSPQDLAGFDWVQPMIEAGVISFKIEGRLKGGPYVAATTQTYRKAIDTALSRQQFRLGAKAERELAQTFSRGLTPGFLDGVDHQKLVRGRFPKSRGIRVGRVTAVERGWVKIQPAVNDNDLIKPGDGLLFDLGKPEENEPGGRVWQIKLLSNRQTAVAFAADGIDLSQVPVGCDVWKTDDPELRKRLQQSYAQDKLYRRVPVRAELTGRVGSVLSLRLSDGESEASVEWPGPLEAARKRATTIEEIRAAIGRLGDTPFELAELTADFDDDLMLPKSVLNDLRRQAAEQLTNRRLAARRHPISEANSLAGLRSHIPAATASQPSDARLTVLVRNLDQLRAVLDWQPADLPKPAMVYCDFEDLRLYREAVPLARSANMPVGLATLRIIKPNEEGVQSPIVRAEPDAVLVRNLGSLDFFREQLPNSQLIGDFSLNVANELTADWFIGQGVSRLVPSFDLNWEQFQPLVRNSPPNWYEPVIHQRMPMFHMEHCVFAAFMSTGKDHRDCGRPCERHRIVLRDRVGAEFPVHPDTGCRNTVYNSVPQSAAEYLGGMMQLGLRHYRVDLLRETPEETLALLDCYGRVLAGLDDGQQTWRQLKALNQIGVTRGTLNLV